MRRPKTHCKHGHEYTPENTLMKASGRNCRMCKTLASKSAAARAHASEYNRRPEVKSRRWKTTGPKGAAAAARLAALEEAATALSAWYPDNANTNAFCAAIRSLKKTPYTPS